LGGLDRGAAGGAEVDAVVALVVAEHGVDAAAVAGGDGAGGGADVAGVTADDGLAVVGVGPLGGDGAVAGGDALRACGGLGDDGLGLGLGHGDLDAGALDLVLGGVLRGGGGGALLGAAR